MRLPTGQPVSQAGGLAPAFSGKWRVELALDAVLAIPRRFAVADQDEASRRWPGGDRCRDVYWILT